MTPTELSSLLIRFRACAAAREATAGLSLAEAWMTCVHGGWMFWFAERVRVERQMLVLAALALARPALKYTNYTLDETHGVAMPDDAWAVIRAYTYASAFADDAASLARFAHAMRDTISIAAVEAAAANC
jgi:hypothetical protein